MEYILAEYKPLPKSVIDQAIDNSRQLTVQRQKTAEKIKRVRRNAVRALRRRQATMNERNKRELSLHCETITAEKNREITEHTDALRATIQENCRKICVSSLTAVLDHFPREMDRALTRVVTALLDSLGNDIITSIEGNSLSLPSSTLKSLCQARNIAIVENRTAPLGDLSISLTSGTVLSSLRQDLHRVVEEQSFLQGEEKSA